MRWIKRIVTTLLFLAVVGGLGWMVKQRIDAVQSEEARTPQRRDARPVPVEVVAVERGPIELRRTFSGTLEASARFIVAPKVSGRIEQLTVDLADTVRRGQVVAQLDNDEYEQSIAQAQADLAVAQAHLAEARSTLEIADRELERTRTLRERGVASESQLDAARSAQLAQQAKVEVAQAQVLRAEASVQTARIRLGYTTVNATWAGGDDTRVVAERHVDEGDTVAASAPLVTIVELDPITAVIFVTEKDYAQLRTEQPVSLTTDAYPGQTFRGRIARVAPVFHQASRQARVELIVDNPQRLLKPGMFVRAEAVLDRVEEATILHADALTKRDDQTCVFVLGPDGQTVAKRFVEVGIRDGDRVQVIGEGIAGHVVSLGQQLIDDGSKVSIPKAPTVLPTAKPRDATEADSE